MTKKLFATLASLALLAGACAMPAAAEETYSLGDVTADGIVDIRDAQEMVGCYNRAAVLNTEPMWTEEQFAAADVNADGMIDASDAACVLGYCVKRIITKGSQNPDIYFAKAAVGVENYSLGDVNMDGVVDVYDQVEIFYAYLYYGVAGKDVPYWTEGQALLADVSNRLDNMDGELWGELNLFDPICVQRYCQYSIIVPDGVPSEDFFMDPFGYLPEEMLEQALESEDVGPLLDAYWDAYHHLLCTKVYGENYEQILNEGVPE